MDNERPNQIILLEMSAFALQEYWKEIASAIRSLATTPTVTVLGRLLKYIEELTSRE